MGFIDIKTNNLSRQLRNSATYIDNWVYVPGTAITGDWKKPYAFRSLDEFQRACGTRSPEGSITYEYVAGLLSAGLPVLFRRIAYQNQNDVTDEDIASGTAVGVKRAETTLTHDEGVDESVTTYVDLKIYEKYGGSFGNDVNITLRTSNNAYYIDVFVGSAKVESKRLVVIPTSITSQTEINEKIINAILSTEFEYIDITVQPDLERIEPEHFSFPIIKNKYLLGGEDIDEGLVNEEIAGSLDFIADKILYQPKFLTSGGYTDTDVSTASPITTALIDLSKKRQDCRALIDLPIGTPANQYQALAQTISYQQNSDTEIIPSASMYGPWQYMQVGNSQLWMPPSFAFLMVMGSDISHGGKAYTPKAGLMNGIVNNVIKPEFEIGSDIAEDWQSDSKANINPIMRLQGGSYVIAGNSTLLQLDENADEYNAFSESSADLAIIEIRRYLYNLAVELQYQYNGTEAFETFSLRASKFLNGMKSENAVNSFDIINVSTNDEPRTLKVQVDVYLTPTIKKIQINLNVSYGNIEMNNGGVA